MSEMLRRLFAPDGESGEHGRCATCRRRPALVAGGQCRACAYVAEQRPDELALKQAGYAVKLLSSAQNVVRWPWPDLHDIGGPLRLGTVNYVAAYTGVGKTTFTLDLVRRWLEQGVGVTVLPLETTPDEWRLSLAACKVGIQHGSVHEIVAEVAEGNLERKGVLDALEAQLLIDAQDPTLLKNLFVVPDRRVNVESVDLAFAMAKSLHHKVVIIDHIDHVDGADQTMGRDGGVKSIRDVNNAVLDLAKLHKLCVIAMSQLNASIEVDGSNPLARFAKPGLKHIAFNSLKIPNANQIWGIFRDIDPQVSRRDFALAREGAIPVQEVLMPWCTSLVALKLRDRGHREGEVANLWYRNGRLEPWTAWDKEQHRAQRLVSDNLAHRTIVFRQRANKDGMSQHQRESNTA